jgi:hypothetical protein
MISLDVLMCLKPVRSKAAELLGHPVPAPHGICGTCKLEGCDEPQRVDEKTGRVHDFCCRGTFGCSQNV